MARRRSVDQLWPSRPPMKSRRSWFANGLAAGGVHGVPKLMAVVLCAAPGRDNELPVGVGQLAEDVEEILLGLRSHYALRARP